MPDRLHGSERDPGASPPPGTTPTRSPRQTAGALVEKLLQQTPGVTPAEMTEPEARRGPVDGPVRVLLLDVDGTLTDGFIVEHHDGDSRHFWVRDGLSMQWARDMGVTVVAISGRSSRAVEHRMNDLGIECHVGVQDKVAVAEQVLQRAGATWAQTVMVGDDLPDVPLLRRVAWPIAVSDAQPEVRALARTITGARGGRGAVREVIEMILRHNGAWQQVLDRYEVP
jgi:3-deoxy-D-manno-octulosonate 8-phosphate phosphatase (KDO 8-P phosphatase)